MNMTHSLPQVYLASDEPKVFQEAMEKLVLQVKLYNAKTNLTIQVEMIILQIF